MSEQSIPFQRIEDLKQYAASYSQLGNDYIFTRITGLSGETTSVPQPMRVSGITFCLMLSGKLSLTVNNTEYKMEAPSLLSISSSTYIKSSNPEKTDIDAYILFISSQFIHDININPNAIDPHLIQHETSPVVDNLSDQETEMLKGYLDLLDRNANTNSQSTYSKNIGRSLIEALFYQLMQIKSEHSKALKPEADPSMARQMAYVQEFMRLLQTHHFTERALTFYADKMFISPKYLSRIIKDITGHSAADWIDLFVIREAKNMLRFSNKNIQQVAYALNFSTQSSFGKFFKHVTGMSPSEYQKT